MQLFERSEEEILEVANQIWDSLIEGSNEMDYQKISKNFSKRMLEDADEDNLKKQLTVFTDPAHHRAVTKGLWLHTKGGPQFTRFFKGS